MKQQAFTTTLAILLAISLSAIVALLISSNVIGSEPAMADSPVPIQIDVLTADTPAPPATDDAAAAPTTDGSGQPATEVPDAPTNPDAPETPTDSTDPETPGGPEAPADPGAPADPADPEAPADPADPVNPTPPTVPEAPEDGPVLGDPPCAGIIIDGECVTIPIACLLGFEWDGDECVFVGCPLGYQLSDGFCQELVLAAPCDAGFVRIGGECVPILVLDPDLILPICPQGEHLVAGVCVPDFVINPDLVLPGLEIAVGG